mmetsp:Transcript_23642/g.67852  ORF Transcript_23642/g.67852 Transcript_23642/m.67852 type:complete len:342 (+) Transcript_23642:63-1088(+)
MRLALAAAFGCGVLARGAGRCSPPTTAADVMRGRDLTGQLHVITGGDKGIGFATASALAAANAAVLVACRNESSGAAAAAEIVKATGNPRVTVSQLDLANFTSVRMFAARLSMRSPRIDSLICCAGISWNTDGEAEFTIDGFDRVFQVDFLSHFILVEQLLPVLRSSHGRVILVSSGSSFWPCAEGNLPAGCTELDALPSVATSRRYFGKNIFGAWSSSYGVAKYLQVFQAAELARREPSIRAYSLRPGTTNTSILSQYSSSDPAFLFLCPPGLPHCPQTPEEGAATSTYLAAARATELAGDNGAHFAACEPATSVRTEMVLSRGEAATLDYQRGLYDMFL